MAKIIVAYILWLCGGVFGLHHFYLGRDKQALVWWMSFGGLLMGWCRDLWRLPEYIYEANNDFRFLNEFAARRLRHPNPRWSTVRFGGQMLIGYIMANLLRLAIPEPILDKMNFGLGESFKVILPIFGSAIGVYLVANIGHQKGAFKWCLVGSICGIPWLLLANQSLVGSCLISAVVASKTSEWNTNRNQQHRTCCKCVIRTFLLMSFGVIYWLLWISVIYHNVHITTSDGTQIPISEAVNNFFNSPAWKDFKHTMNDLYTFCQTNGWSHCYDELIEHLDPSGEKHAYKVLEFESMNPSPEEIQSQCRKMARKWHPDKFKTEEEKHSAQEKFIEVQKACDILNDMRHRRAKKNMKSARPVPPYKDKHSEL